MKPVFALVALVATLCSAVSAPAAIVTLTLDPASASANRLALSIAGQNATTDLSGTIEADLNIDLVTGVISEFRLNSGSITGTPWEVPALGLTVTESTATAETNLTPATVFSQVNGTSFLATEHQLRLTGGTATVIGDPPIPLAGTILEGLGNGTITSTLNGGQYDIFFQMTIDDEAAGLPAPLFVTGPLVARGSVTAIPEPSSVIALAGIFGAACMRRRRR